MYSRDSKIMRKLLGKASADNSTDTTSPGLGITSAPHLQPAYRPSASQYTVYDAGYPILSVDPWSTSDRRTALLASRHVLKTVAFDGLKVVEGVDLRAAISAASSNPVKSSSAFSSTAPDQLSVKEAKWANDSTIFTACANGKIFSYDINRIAQGGSPFDCVQMREDSRQVNTVDVNPHWVSTLLSGSQDGLVRTFDIRAPVQSRAGGYLTYKLRASLKCNADGVRHAKWSPRDGYQLACGTDAGVVLKWDVRKPNTPLLRITAHEKACASISWHPDGNHLVSGGWDQKCAVWDMSKTADKRQKPKWVVHTPAPVSAVAWRPPLWSANAQGKRAAQLAVSYDHVSVKRYGIKAVHIWDLARPTLPFKEIDWFASPPSSLAWLDQDILWAAGDEGKFHQCDVAFARKVVDRVSPSSMAFSGRGEVAMFLDERPIQRPRPAIVHQQEITAAPRSTYGSSPSTPMLSISRSDSEDDVVGSFLSPRRRMADSGRKRRASLRSAPALSTTPPSGSGHGEIPVLGLEQAMKLTGLYKTQQAMAVGRVPATAKTNTYQYLSQCYFETLQRELPYVSGGRSMAERVGAILEHFAAAAEGVGQFRLAQTWRILAYAMGLLLKRRAQYHLESRLGYFAKRPSVSNKARDAAKAGDRKTQAPAQTLESLHGEHADQPQRRPSAMSASHMRSLLSEEIESTSNVATPVARPYDAAPQGEGQGPFHKPGKMLTPVIELDGFSLPPAASTLDYNNSPRERLGSEPLSTASGGSEETSVSNTEGYDFYDADAISHAIDVRDHDRDQDHDRGRGRGGGGQDYDDSRGMERPPPPPTAWNDSGEGYSNVFSMSTDASKSSTAANEVVGSPRSPGRFETVDERHGHEHGNDNCNEHKTDHDNDGHDDEQGEYESRIRGKELEESPELLHNISSAQNHRRQRPRDVSPGEQEEEEEEEGIFMISQTTMASDMVTSSEEPSQQAQSFVSDEYAYKDEPPHDHAHAPLHVGVLNSPAIKKSPEDGGHVPLESTPTIVESDYLPWPKDPDYPHPLLSSPVPLDTPPLDPHSLISRALDFELRTSVLNASAMILLLKPLVPERLIDPDRAAAILRSHHARLVSMRLFVEAALLRNLCVRGWPEGLPEWGDNYTAVFGPAQQGVKGGLLCPSCRKPREMDPKKGPGALWRCERCGAHMGPCAVCGHREASAASASAVSIGEGMGMGMGMGMGVGVGAAADDVGENIMSLWWYCPGCAHGGHASCIQAWHAPEGPDADPSVKDAAGHAVVSGDLWAAVGDSDGCCPLDGCGHACLPGKWRDERATQRADEVGRAAAEKARTGAGVGAGPGSGHGPGPGLPGSNSATPSRKGSVGAASAGLGQPGGGGGGLLVRGDGMEVPQSRAVESVREALAAGGLGSMGSSGGSGSIGLGRGLGHGPGAGGILSSSPGRHGERGERDRERDRDRDPERRKSVKFVPTER